jgi:hypothetical protein
VVLSDDEKFALDLKSRVQEDYHLLCALLNPNLLYLAKEEGDISATIKSEMGRFFNEGRKLKPIEQILGLDRKKLLKDSRALLPFWYTVPVIRQLMALLRGLFKGKKKKRPKQTGDWVNRLADAQSGEESGTLAVLGSTDGRDNGGGGSVAGRSGTANQSVAYRKQVKALVAEFVGSEREIDGTLEELAEKWNPLFEEQAKRNLVADVDSFIRDFARSLRRGFRVKPPDAARIRNLAEECSHKEALAKIRKKEYLQRYIEIYMIRLLLKPASR